MTHTTTVKERRGSPTSKDPRNQISRTFLILFLTHLVSFCWPIYLLLMISIASYSRILPLVLISILLCTNGEVIVKENFIYTKIGTSNINDDYVFTGRKYLACDLIKSKEIIENIIETHSKLCNTELKEKNKLKDSPIVHNYNDHFILLKGQYTQTQAIKRCESIGSHLVEVRNKLDAENLNSFLGANNILFVFAGIIMNSETHEAIFLSNYDLATGKYYKNVYTAYKDYDVLNSWRNVMDKHYQKQGTIFLYEKGASEVILHTYYPNGQSNSEQYYLEGVTRKLPVICKRNNIETNSNSDSSLTIWKQQCKSRHALMIERGKQTLGKLTSCLPENMPSRHLAFNQFIFSLKTKQSIASNQWKNLIANDVDTTASQCQHYLQSLDDSNSITKRSAIFSLISIVGTAVSIFSKIHTLLQSKSNPGGKVSITARDKAVIESFNDIQFLSRQFDAKINSNINFTIATTSDLILINDFERICQYVDSIYSKLNKLAYTDMYKPKLNREFITQNELNAYATDIYNNYKIRISNDLNLVNILVVNTKKSFIFGYGLPLENSFNKVNIFSITNFPTFRNDSKFIVNPTYNFVAIHENPIKFTPLTDVESFQCILEKKCVITSPTYPPNYPTCGINEFLNYKSSCKFFQAQENNPTFILIKNQTFYSLNSSVIPISLQCLSSQYQKSGSDSTFQISGKGVFSIPAGCQAEYDNILLRPGIRMLDNDETKVDAIDSVTTYQLDTSLLRNVTKRILKNSSGKDWWRKFLFVILSTCFILFGLSCIATLTFRHVLSRPWTNIFPNVKSEETSHKQSALKIELAPLEPIETEIVKPKKNKNTEKSQ